MGSAAAKGTGLCPTRCPNGEGRVGKESNTAHVTTSHTQCVLTDMAFCIMLPAIFCCCLLPAAAVDLAVAAPLQAVSDIIRTTLGPRSMLKMLLDPNGGV